MKRAPVPGLRVGLDRLLPHRTADGSAARHLLVARPPHRTIDAPSKRDRGPPGLTGHARWVEDGRSIPVAPTRRRYHRARTAVPPAGPALRRGPGRPAGGAPGPGPRGARA